MRCITPANLKHLRAAEFQELVSGTAVLTSPFYCTLLVTFHFIRNFSAEFTMQVIWYIWLCTFVCLSKSLWHSTTMSSPFPLNILAIKLRVTNNIMGIILKRILRK